MQGPKDVFVLDCSITLAWCFTNEATTYTENVLESTQNALIHVPNLWLLEIGNILCIAEQKKRISRAQFEGFIADISCLPITIDACSTFSWMSHVIDLARQYSLTTYDASYLELALRLELPLATLDNALLRAAKQTGVAIYQPNVP